jgi:uncharacterized cupredoxin-like copper-binding protein
MKVLVRRSRATGLLLSAILLALVACGGSGAGGPSRTKTVRIILGHLRFAPADVTVQAGTKVHFVLQNSDAIDHEFVLGSDAVQQEHEDMRMSGGHMMDDAGMVAVGAGKTVDLSFTFSTPGRSIYGCHVDDHYSQGMKGVVTVTA